MTEDDQALEERKGGFGSTGVWYGRYISGKTIK
jgi:hypothetical protein